MEQADLAEKSTCEPTFCNEWKAGTLTARLNKPWAPLGNPEPAFNSLCSMCESQGGPFHSRPFQTASWPGAVIRAEGPHSFLYLRGSPSICLAGQNRISQRTFGSLLLPRSHHTQPSISFYSLCQLSCLRKNNPPRFYFFPCFPCSAHSISTQALHLWYFLLTFCQIWTIYSLHLWPVATFDTMNHCLL